MTESDRVKQTAKDVILSLEALSSVKRKAAVIRAPDVLAKEWRNSPPEISPELRAQFTNESQITEATE